MRQFLLLAGFGILLIHCTDVNQSPEPGNPPITAVFSNLAADGSSSTATTKLTLTFDQDISGLTAADITLNAGTTGAVKGALTKPIGMGVYDLAVSGITATGAVTVTAVTKPGYAISGAPKAANVYYTPPVAVVFSNLTADGSSSAATTKLTLTFDKDIAGLTAADIALGPETIVNKGALTKAAGTGVYNLGVSLNTTTNKNVTVSAVTKSGYIISGAPKSVTVYPPQGTTASSWRGLTVTTGTAALRYENMNGRNDVLHVTPGSGGGYWAVLTYSLSEYAGKDITIAVSVDVWPETSGKVAWQANLGSTYPVIAGSTQTPLSAGEWHTVSGSNTITVPSGGGTLYLSAEQLGSAKAYLAGFTVTISEPPEEGSGTGKELTLTIGAKEDLKPRLTGGKAITTWTSSAPTVASVTSNGIVTALAYTTGGTSIDSSAATGTATITAKASDNTTETFTVTTTMEAQVDMMQLPSLKDQFDQYFMIGNIYNPGDANNASGVNNARLTRHYNILTPENNMKPDNLSAGNNGELNTTNITTAVRMIDAARASGIKVVGHTLLWHSQLPAWQSNLNASTGKETALGYMRDYIKAIAGHANIKGKIHSWDVLNEVFPDGVSSNADWKTAMRTTGDSQAANPWFVSIGSDFVYEGFKAAREADPNAILYYNDYNMDNVGKSTMVRNMVRDVNNQWINDAKYDNRLLIEGIGMQSHHNTTVTVNNIRNTLNLFRELGVKISISEIDVLCYPYSGSTPSFSPNRDAPFNSGKLQAANLYGEYMKLFLENADIIERVTFWGVYDEQSWRKEGLPLIFEGTAASKAKPAYYKLIGALE